MIELRWYTHASTPVVLMETLMGVARERTLMTTGVRVLQYRVDPSCGLGDWTDWQDVPEVSGECDIEETSTDG